MNKATPLDWGFIRVDIKTDWQVKKIESNGTIPTRLEEV